MEKLLGILLFLIVAASIIYLLIGFVIIPIIKLIRLNNKLKS